VREGADGRGPGGSGRRGREEKVGWRGEWAGRGSRPAEGNWAAVKELGRARRAGPVGKEEGGWAGGLKGREEELRVLGSFLFFLNLFKLTFQTFEIELFSKHSKIFKTFF
jgi:hypothetical protein